MTDFVFATTPIDTSIPVVAVVFNINNLIYDETDPLTDVTARVNLVSTGQSPVIDDTGSFLYGWPRERSSSNANQITVIPLPATKDATGDGVHIRNLAGTDVHYTLTVTGTRNSLPVTLVNAQRFDVDAATANGALFADLAAQPSAQFSQPLTSSAQAAIDAYISELIGLGSITGASAYEVAVADGFVGDETAWLASLVPDGETLVVDGGTNLTATTLNAGLTELADDAVVYAGVTQIDASAAQFDTDVSSGNFAALMAAVPIGGQLNLTRNITTTTVATIPLNKRLNCTGQRTTNGAIIANHAGTAVNFAVGSHNEMVHRIIASKQTVTWYDGTTDTTSIGVELDSIFNSQINVLSSGFHTGIRAGQTGGVAYNDMRVFVTDSKVGLSTPVTAGYCSNNNWSGKIRNTSSSPLTPLAGSAFISLADASQNTFIGFSLEGDRTERSIYFADVYNCFYNPRFESPAPIEFDTGSSNNLIDHGYGIFGPEPEVQGVDIIYASITERQNNIVRGGHGATYRADVDQSAAAVVVHDVTNSRGTIVGLDGSGNVLGGILGQNVILKDIGNGLYYQVYMNNGVLSSAAAAWFDGTPYTA